MSPTRSIVIEGIANFIGDNAEQNAALFRSVPGMRHLLLEAMVALRSPLPPSKRLLKKINSALAGLVIEP